MIITLAYASITISQGAVPSTVRQHKRDFRSLGHLIHSGDLEGARSAYARLSESLKSAKTEGRSSALVDESTAVGRDFQALGEALRSGDLGAAEDAFHSLRHDIREAGRGRAGRGHQDEEDGMEAVLLGRGTTRGSPGRAHGQEASEHSRHSQPLGGGGNSGTTGASGSSGSGAASGSSGTLGSSGASGASGSSVWSGSPAGYPVPAMSNCTFALMA